MTKIKFIVFCEAGLIEEDAMESREEKDKFELISRVISKIFKDFYLKIDAKTKLDKSDYFTELFPL